MPNHSALNRINHLFTILLLGVVLSACEQNNLKVDPVVVTEDLLFISGGAARVSGRLVATEAQPVSEHGFLISTSETFSDPITISLGERTIPGRFIGEANDLRVGQTYFWKPFTIIEGNTLEGEPAQFTTLNPQINFISPTISSAGQFILIDGRNFTPDTEVFIDGRQAAVVDIEKESIIKAIIPPIGDNIFTEVRVTVQDVDLIAEQQFEYVIGKWDFQDNFITDKAYSENLSIVDGDKFLFGLGAEFSTSNPTIWELDIPSFTWSETSFDKGIARAPFYGPTFFGSGEIVPRDGSQTDAFYIYEGGEFQPRNPLPFKLHKGIAAVVNGELYVYGGFRENGFPNFDVWKYNSAGDSWEINSGLPAEVNSDNPNFVHGDNVYFITIDQLVYRYDPVSGSLENISFYPSNFLDNGKGISEVIGDKAYIGIFGQNRTLWEYNITENSWKKKTGFAGGAFTRTVSSFVYNDIIYVLKNPESNSTAGMAIWTFKPEEI